VNLEEVFRSGNRRLRSVAILGKRLEPASAGYHVRGGYTFPCTELVFVRVPVPVSSAPFGILNVFNVRVTVYAAVDFAGFSW
jgi:hypothetical protein